MYIILYLNYNGIVTSFWLTSHSKTQKSKPKFIFRHDKMGVVGLVRSTIAITMVAVKERLV